MVQKILSFFFIPTFKFAGDSTLEEVPPAITPDKRSEISEDGAQGSLPPTEPSQITTILKLLFVFGLVYFFLVSIGLMGAAFKGFGKGFAEALISSTENPFVGLFIGIFATSLVQSSSTTTSMAVAMVGAGVLSIEHTVPIIMGANIGTTVTNLLVSLAHIHEREEFKRAIAGSAVHDFFNVICVAILFPLELATGFLQKSAIWLTGIFSDVGGITFTSPVKSSTKPVIHWIESTMKHNFSFTTNVCYALMLAISIVMMFACLYFIVKTMRGLIAQKAKGALGTVIEHSGVWGIFAGLCITILVQSSSITTSLLVPLVASGMMTVEAVFPVTLGANIGTTATAILASFATGNLAAITIAFVHFLFNAVGVAFFYPIQFLRNLPIRMAKGLGELAYKRRRIAVFYVVFSFFLLPSALIFVYEQFFSH